MSTRRLARFSVVRGLPVVGRGDGALVGKLDDVLLHVESLTAIGYAVRSGFWKSRKGVAAANVERLGRDFVIVRDEEAAEAAGESRGRLDDRVWVSEWLGCLCLTRRGGEVGRLGDVLFDGDGQRVRALMLEGGRLLVPGRRCEVGRDSLVVDDDDAVVALPDSPDSAAWWTAVEALLP